MLQLVLADIPQFEWTSLEVDNRETSYTVQTLKRLPPAHYRLILTKESAAAFSQWKEPEEIQRLAPLLIGDRTFPISSTGVRERLKKKLYCGHLVPEKALYYIAEHRLY
jgi:nicotinate-nucleotide adenylyltransferase